ncbi:hypothetical protein BSIG_5847 [Bacteroides thetaiotaomicron]|nr:hypothetical protein BSIG_5847 [Bacteroides thetaiotaomicron]
MQKVIRILQLRILGDEGDGSTSSQEVFHASPFPLPAGERVRRTAVTSGLTCSVPFTRSGPVGLLVRTLVASSRWYSPARRLTWDVSPLCSERISLYTVSGRNTSSRPSAVILNVKDIPSSRCLFRLVPSVPRTEGTVSGLLPTPIASDFKVRGPGSQQKGLPEIIREMLLPTPTATEIHHWQRVERWKRQGRTSMHETEDGEKNPNGLTDFLDFHGLLPTLEHIGRKGKNPRQGGLPDFFAQTGRSFQLNPLFVAEMMGFPTSWTVLPFLPGGSSPSRDTGTPSSPR